MMANETKTENFIYDHFKQFESEVIIEKKKSDNPRIDKLLKNASKRVGGTGVGQPDFIISFINNNDLLMVIECKANKIHHESSNHESYKHYAVDGVLLYSSFLSKEFDVIAIAVSGEMKDGALITHFLQLNKEIKQHRFLNDNLLSPSDYINSYQKSDIKYRQDLTKLGSYSTELNKEFHKYGVKETDRALIISGSLMALKNKSFKESYTKHITHRDLAKSLVHTIELQLEAAQIDSSRLEAIKEKFNFIEVHETLSKQDRVLFNIIKGIEDNIESFQKTHQYFDAIGQFYIEFLRYANSDKKLGIVLTPRHIAEFMAEVAEINQDSVVYDNCAGTGGFLVAAMDLMIKKANHDRNKIKEIQKNQLFGVEKRADIYALAFSNMFIHDDGKTNLEQGDCFDKDIIKNIKNKSKNKNLNIGLLNPPYKSDKKNDIEELEYVLNNLECLAPNSKCVTILPMQAALANETKQKRIYNLKKRIMEKHTLEAVFSMPDQLFHNSKANVVTCIMVFTAYKPHPTNKETFFGYFKDDGHIIRKVEKRCDIYGQWEGRKAKWLDAYFNKKNIAGLSINAVVDANSQWCAEAYMETDYSHNNIFRYDFVNELSEHIRFNVWRSILLNEEYPVLTTSVTNKETQFNFLEWKYFYFNDLFNIKGSTTTPKDDLKQIGKGSFPFVTTQATNNGVEGLYDYYTEQRGVLTIDSAVIGYCAYQPYDFSASDHVEKLIPKFSMNKYIALFLTTIINKEQYRYNYGRKASQARLKNEKIKLPATPDGQPDWQFMEDYIKSLPYSASL